MAEPSRARDLAFLLPLIGALLVTPPILLLLSSGADIHGVPLVPAFLFTLWLLLIVLTRSLSRHLWREHEQSEADDETSAGGAAGGD